MMSSVGTSWMWIGFILFITLVLLADIFLLSGNRSRPVSTRKALTWVTGWVAVALIFNVLLWQYISMTSGYTIAHQKALEFFTGYLVEESLSVDNLFVFILIFHFFSVPEQYQRRVLLYGVVSAVIFRLMMIVSGTWLVSQFHWVLYLFGVFLLFTGIKMLLSRDEKKDLAMNPLFLFLKKHVRLTETYHEEKFFIRQHNRWVATPLFLALILIEISDLIFALDSIPVIFSITNDVFIIFTSNIFAILGLRWLYFLLSNMESRFVFLKYGIAVILTLIGVKMLIAHWVTIPIGYTLSMIVIVLVTSIMWRKRC